MKWEMRQQDNGFVSWPFFSSQIDMGLAVSNMYLLQFKLWKVKEKKEKKEFRRRISN